MNKQLVIILTIVALGLLSAGGYLFKNFLEDSATEPLTPYYPAVDSRSMSRFQIARYIVKKFYRPTSYIQDCKRFPENIMDMHDQQYKDSYPQCRPYSQLLIEHAEFIYRDESPWIDPWGRPYQIRYDLERAKLQLRSQGRYLWTEYDDIFQETYFDGKSYKEQVEYCKKVARDDMTCIFNRGWH